MTAEKKDVKKELKEGEALARPEEKPVKRKSGLYVKPGRSITSKKGILGPGTKLEVNYFAEGVFNTLKEGVNSPKSTVEEVR